MKTKIYTLYLSVVRGKVMGGVRRFVSPLFLVTLLASFTLWYVTKLHYTYTTEFEVEVQIEDQNFRTMCVVEGVGTNLLGYHIYKGSSMRIPLDELSYRTISRDKKKYLSIDKSSLSNAISVRYSDIKLISVGNHHEVQLSERIEKVLNDKK